MRWIVIGTLDEDAEPTSTPSTTPHADQGSRPAARAIMGRIIPFLPAILCATAVAIWIFKPVGDVILTLTAYAVFAFGAGATILSRRGYMDRGIAILFGLSLLAGVFGTVLGMAHGNPGAYSEAVFFVALPLVWSIFTVGVDRRMLQLILNIIPFVTLAIAAIGVAYWADATGRLSMPWVNLIDLGQGIGSTDYGSQMRYYPISSLVFVLPFLVGCLMLGATLTWRAARIVSPIALVLGVFLLFVAGRRGIMLSLVAGVVVGIVLMLRRPRTRALIRRIAIVSAIGLAAAVALAALSGLSFAVMIESVFGEASSSNGLRARSGAELLESWLQSPVWGNGLGATIDGEPRSIERPWEFELQYHLVLNAVGVLGFVMLAGVTIAIFVRAFIEAGRSESARAYLAPVAAGSASLLVANATNPYLHTPGHYWMLFLLVIAVNVAVRERTRERETAIDG